MPLIQPPSDLGYGLEPHDLIYSVPGSAVRGAGTGGVAGVYPGWCGMGGYQEGAIPGTNQY